MIDGKEDTMSEAIIKTIKATSRASVKIKDNFYTIEYSEERIIPEGIDLNIETERAELWNTVNTECDNQIEEILESFRKR